MSDGSEAILAQLNRIIGGLESGAIQTEAGFNWLERDVKPRARLLVPVLTGATQRSIDGRPGPGGVVVFAGTDYSKVIEFGGPNGRLPNPFLLPAIRSTLPRLGVHFARAINRRKK